jgi:hypothetical protein
VLIREPKRGRFDVEMTHENTKIPTKEKVGASKLIQSYLLGFVEIFRNPCSRWIILAGCFRFWAGNAVGYYTGKYFNIYPDLVVSLIIKLPVIELIFIFERPRPPDWRSDIKHDLRLHFRSFR